MGTRYGLTVREAEAGDAPRFLDRLWDSPALLNWVSRFAVRTQPQDLGALTVAVLEGAAGPQKKEIARLVEWLRELRPDVVHLTNSLLASLAPPIRRELGIPVVCALQGEDLFLSNLPICKGFDHLMFNGHFTDPFI